MPGLLFLHFPLSQSSIIGIEPMCEFGGRVETVQVFYIEDLISIGTIGLIKAINTYDAYKNIKLVTYASRCIENEILMFLRKTSNRKTDNHATEKGNSAVYIKFKVQNFVYTVN